MADLISAVTTAIGIARKLREVEERLHDAELKCLLADLSLELAETKVKLSELIQENQQLKQQVAKLECAEDICPKCKKQGWAMEKSEPDRIFGPLGGLRKTFLCRLCGYSEEKLDTGRQ
ncbi:MAG: hypothetical protein GX565_05285 [Lentisphaerae bacterium]|nr:hypothetical protein [Lentisphaerota bacterium]